MSTDSATLLCRACNNQKHGAWPSRFYKNKAKLKRLAVLTGYPFELLEGPPQLNGEAVDRILHDVEAFLVEWIHYPEDIKKVRGLILKFTGRDIFDLAENVPPHLREDEK